MLHATPHCHVKIIVINTACVRMELADVQRGGKVLLVLSLANAPNIRVALVDFMASVTEAGASTELLCEWWEPAQHVLTQAHAQMIAMVITRANALKANVFVDPDGTVRTAHGPLKGCAPMAAMVTVSARSLLPTATATLDGLVRHVKHVWSVPNGRTGHVLEMVSASMADATAERDMKILWTAEHQILAHAMKMENSVQEMASASKERATARRVSGELHVLVVPNVRMSVLEMVFVIMANASVTLASRVVIAPSL